MTESYPPRRRYPRIASHHAVLARNISGEELESFGHTKSMAVGGCCFVSDEGFAAGTPIELLISIDRSVVAARGNVIYARQLENQRFEIGVEFAPLTEENAEAIQRVFEKPAQLSDDE